MKKLTLITIAILGIALASFGSNSSTALTSTDNNSSVTEKVNPHTKQYQDMKKIIDEYEEAVNKATSCDDLDNAAIKLLVSMLALVEVVNMLALVEVDYKENELITEQEEKELNAIIDRTDTKIDSLKTQWNCPVEEEEPEEELIPTSSQEWEGIINEFEVFVNKLEKMKNLDFEDESNLDQLLELISESAPLLQRIQQSDPETLTEQQSNRFEKLSVRFENTAKAIGLLDDLNDE